MFTPSLAPPSASASASAPTPAIATASSVHETLHWASEFAKSDREVMAAACAIDGHALEFASDALKVCEVQIAKRARPPWRWRAI